MWKEGGREGGMMIAGDEECEVEKREYKKTGNWTRKHHIYFYRWLRQVK